METQTPSIQPYLNPEPPKFKDLNHKVLYTVIGVLLLIVIAGAVYWWQAEKETVENLQQINQQNHDSKKYSNPFFEFQYPSNLSIHSQTVVSEHKIVNGVDRYGFVSVQLSSNENPEYQLYVTRIQNSLSLNEFFEAREKEFSTFKKTDQDSFNRIKINGLDATEIHLPQATDQGKTRLASYSVDIYVEKFIVSFDYVNTKNSQKDLENFKSIISTFHVVENDVPS